MKSAKVLFDTIYGKCSNGDMYSWKACKPKEHDNVVSFDVRQKGRQSASLLLRHKLF